MDTSARYREDFLRYGSGTIYRGPAAGLDDFRRDDLEPIRRGITLRIYNTSGLKIGEITSEVSGQVLLAASWELLPTGCGGASFTFSDVLPQFVSLPFNTRIDVHLSGAIAPIWSGFLRRLPSPITSTWPRTFEGYGFQAHLDRVIIRQQDYSEQITSRAVAELVRDYLDPSTGILYSASKICSSCRYRIRDIQFRYITVRRAMEQLAGLAGEYEWGVDADREFFFRRESREITESWWVGRHVAEADVDEDYEDMANRIWVQSGQRSGSGDNFLPLPLDDAGSQAAYGMWESIVRAPSVFNLTDAYRFASVELARRAQPAVRASARGIEYQGQPVDCRGLVRLVGRDGTEITARKRRVRYTLTGSRLTLDVDLGEREIDLPGWVADLGAQQARLELIQQSTNRQV